MDLELPTDKDGKGEKQIATVQRNTSAGSFDLSGKINNIPKNKEWKIDVVGKQKGGIVTNICTIKSGTFKFPKIAIEKEIEYDLCAIPDKCDPDTIISGRITVTANAI